MKRYVAAPFAGLLTAAMLAACGGGGGSHGAPPAAVPIPPAKATSVPKATGRAGASFTVKFAAVNRLKTIGRKAKTERRSPKFVDPRGGTLHIVATSADMSQTATTDVTIDASAVRAAAGAQTVSGIPIVAPAGTLTITEYDLTPSNCTGCTIADPGAPMATTTVSYTNIVAGSDVTLAYTGNSSTDTLSAPLLLAPIPDLLQISDANYAVNTGYVVQDYFFLNGTTASQTFDYNNDNSIFSTGGLSPANLPLLDHNPSGYCMSTYTAPTLSLFLADSEGAYQTSDGQPLFPSPTVTVLSQSTIVEPTPTPNPSASPTTPPSPGTATFAYGGGTYQPVFPYIDGYAKTQISAIVSWTGIDPRTLQTSTIRVPLTIIGPPAGNRGTNVPGGLCVAL